MWILFLFYNDHAFSNPCAAWLSHAQWHPESLQAFVEICTYVLSSSSKVSCKALLVTRLIYAPVFTILCPSHPPYTILTRFLLNTIRRRVMSCKIILCRYYGRYMKLTRRGPRGPACRTCGSRATGWQCLTPATTPSSTATWTLDIDAGSNRYIYTILVLFYLTY